MAAETNKAIIRRHYEALWSRGDIAVADEYVAVDRVDHNPLPGQGPGREGLKQMVARMHAAFEPRFEVEALIAEGDYVVGLFTMHGRHRGTFMGIPPTGAPVRMAGIDVFRIVDGQMVEIWHQQDTLGLMKQIGAGLGAQALRLVRAPFRAARAALAARPSA